MEPGNSSSEVNVFYDPATREFRCKSCHKVLCKINDFFGKVDLEPLSSQEIINRNASQCSIDIKCGKCKTVNRIYYTDLLSLKK